MACHWSAWSNGVLQITPNDGKGPINREGVFEVLRGPLSKPQPRKENRIDRDQDDRKDRESKEDFNERKCPGKSEIRNPKSE